ncbi:hypothetical protein LCGC14_1917890 [marine sediment metagenome]|uniref:Uncharacterized protein n=1 Tax=marine sediment metagenome TaxID=412755 RepID=A0A0F9IPF5_9ZZZZ
MSEVPKDELGFIAYYHKHKNDIKDILNDLKEFELKRYSDMMRTLTKLREKLEGKLKE